MFSWIYYNCYIFPVKTLFLASCYVIDFFFRSISANSIGLLLPVQSSTGIKNVFSSVVVSFFFLLFFLVNLLGNKIAFKLTWKGIFRSVFEGRSSQLYMQLMQLRKESLKKIQACTGFEPLTLNSAVHLYNFHIFIISSSSFHEFITNQFNDLLPVGLLA